MEKRYAPGDLPSGITLDRKVIRLPNIADIFNRALWIQACIYNPIAICDSYRWIRRGDPYAKLVVFTPMTRLPFVNFFAKKALEVFLRSPVSGLMLHGSARYGDADKFEASTPILLPDDEPPAENSSYIFESLCATC